MTLFQLKISLSLMTREPSSSFFVSRNSRFTAAKGTQEGEGLEIRVSP